MLFKYTCKINTNENLELLAGRRHGAKTTDVRHPQKKKPHYSLCLPKKGNRL